MDTLLDAVFTAAKAWVEEEENWDREDKTFRKGISVDPEKEKEWEHAFTTHILKSLDLAEKLKKAVKKYERGSNV